METVLSIITICAILSSALIAVLVSQRIDYNREIGRRKYKVLEALVAGRYETDGEVFLKAYNSIPVIFKEYDEVIKLYRDSYEAISKKERVTETLTDLILKICKVMGYKNIEKKDIENVVGKDKRKELLNKLYLEMRGH